MSAFVVSNSCINKCVAAMRSDHTILTSKDGDKLGRELLAMNLRAVNARYSENDAPPPYRFSPVAPNAYAQVKALECLLYQCSEGEVPSEPLFKKVELALDRLRAKIVRSLPQYEAAEWGS